MPCLKFLIPGGSVNRYKCQFDQCVARQLDYGSALTGNSQSPLFSCSKFIIYEYIYLYHLHDLLNNICSNLRATFYISLETPRQVTTRVNSSDVFLE
jgi:hypothetical protein